ncbi:hypothetical protein ACFLTH_05780 [Bacteroidota bacterium]
MNIKQKRVILIGIGVILVSLIIWGIFGFEIFTKDQVLIEEKDELFGMVRKVWVDKFIWGLDLSLAISGFTAAASVVLTFLFRTKKIKSNKS